MKDEALFQQASFSEFEVPDFPRIHKVLRVVSPRSPGVCVDLGYCKGSFADYLAPQGWYCIGIDIVHRVPINLNIQIIQSNLFRGIPIADQSTDLITAGELIEHMTDESWFLQECWRILKPGGWLVLTTPNLSFLLNRILVPLGKMPMFVYAPYHYRIFNPSSLVKVLQANQFSVKHVSSSHVLYSRRKHPTGIVFEIVADMCPNFGAHIIVVAEKSFQI